MADVPVARGDDVRALLMQKPELLERLLGTTIDRGTLKNEHWIDVHPGRQKIDFVFQNAEGKHHVVKVALEEKPRWAIRHPNIWQKRWGEINNLKIDDIVAILLIDEETLSANPHDKKILDGFSNITVVPYKAAEIKKELGG